MGKWSEKDRAEVIERIDRALPAYEAVTGRAEIRRRQQAPAFSAVVSLLCVTTGLFMAFWVFPARPGPFIVTVPIFPLFGAIAMASWLGGAFSGWCSVALSLIAIAYFWLPSVNLGCVAWLFGISLTFACVAMSAAGSSVGRTPSSGGVQAYRKLAATD